MANEPFVPYRRMPWTYLATWIVVIGLGGWRKWVDPARWPPNNYAEFLAENMVGPLVVAYFLAWGTWRAGLYKKFPPK